MNNDNDSIPTIPNITATSTLPGTFMGTFVDTTGTTTTSASQGYPQMQYGPRNAYGAASVSRVVAEIPNEVHIRAIIREEIAKAEPALAVRLLTEINRQRKETK